MKNFLIIIYILVIYASFAFTDEPVRAVWVPCEGEYRALQSREKIDSLLDNSKKLGINTIFVQVYRGNRAWYDSKIADSAPFQTIKKNAEIDPLAYIVKKAHAQGIEIHAWCNIFRIAKNKDAPILKKIGASAVTADNHGRSLLSYTDFRIPPPEGNYYSYGNDGIWLEAGNPKVREYKLRVLEEILQGYPEIDGIHLDFVRYPFCTPVKLGSRFYYGVDYGYGMASIDAFVKSGGFNPLTTKMTREMTITWDTWRRSRITEFIREAHELCKQHGKTLSAAVIAWPDIAYNASGQNWMSWLKNSQIDIVIPMLYTTDISALLYAMHIALSFRTNNQVYIGFGAYLFTKKMETEFKNCWDAVISLNPDGIVIFSYDSILKDKKQLSFISNNKRERDTVWEKFQHRKEQN